MIRHKGIRHDDLLELGRCDRDEIGMPTNGVQVVAGPRGVQLPSNPVAFFLLFDFRVRHVRMGFLQPVAETRSDAGDGFVDL